MGQVSNVIIWPEFYSSRSLRFLLLLLFHLKFTFLHFSTEFFLVFVSVFLSHLIWYFIWFIYFRTILTYIWHFITEKKRNECTLKNLAIDNTFRSKSIVDGNKKTKNSIYTFVYYLMLLCTYIYCIDENIQCNKMQCLTMLLFLFFYSTSVKREKKEQGKSICFLSIL